LPETDLQLLIDAAKESSKIATKFFQSDPQVWEKSDDAGPVTEADLAVNTYLEGVLRTERPDYGWLSEETEDDCKRLEKSRVFVIDPIDGTRAFIAGRDMWAHSIALVEDGVPVAGVVYLPVMDLMFEATIGGGARLNGQPITPSGVSDLDAANVLTAKVSAKPEHWKDGTSPEYTSHFRSSLAYRMALIANGEFDAMLTLRGTWEWDIAAGALLVSEAGGLVSDRRGNALQFNNAKPMVDGVLAAPATLHKTLLSKLA